MPRATRTSKFPLLTVPEALSVIFRETSPLKPHDVEVFLPGSTSNHPVLAQDVFAKDPLPPYRASMVDGYAVVCGDGAGKFPVIAELKAGSHGGVELTAGSVAYVTTGGPIPVGADGVVKVEDTVAECDESGREIAVTVSTPATPNMWIREVGSDVAIGQKVLNAGDIITSSELGILATVGVPVVSVHRTPVVGVLSTGDELVDASTDELPPGRIRDSNRAMLLAAVTDARCVPVDCGVIRDDHGATRAAISSAFESVDVLLTSGGVSMGDHDFVKPVLEELGTVQFGRVLMKPGKPLVFATIDTPKGRKFAFGLPGNPVSSAVTFQLFVLPALKRLKGIEPPLCIRATVPCKLATALPMDPERPEYHRATVYRDGDGVVASSTGSQRSSRLMSMYGANAFVCVPQGSGMLPQGSLAEAILVGEVFATKPVWVASALAPAKPEIDCCDHRHHHGHSDTRSEAKSALGPTVDAGYDPAGFRVCVLTVSDRVSRGEAEDRSGPTACKSVASIPGFKLSRPAELAVVSDNVEAIQGKLVQWCDGPNPPHLILTTGGTGFGVRDVTPEATRALLHKPAIGLVVAMLSFGLQKLPAAMLSRPEAGVRGSTLIVNLPGSTGGVKDGIQALSPVLSHALQLIADSPTSKSHPN